MNLYKKAMFLCSQDWKKTDHLPGTLNGWESWCRILRHRSLDIYFVVPLTTTYLQTFEKLKQSFVHYTEPFSVILWYAEIVYFVNVREYYTDVRVVFLYPG